MRSESSTLLKPNSLQHGLTASQQGIVGQVWVIYVIYFCIAALSAMSTGPKLHLQTEMLCRWESFGMRRQAFGECDASEIVNSRLTALLTLQSITLGSFSALSTGYWTRRVSLRTSPRSSVLLLVFLGIALNEIIFILVHRLHAPVFVLLVGSLIEGILGGPATLNTLLTGYLHKRLAQHEFSTATGLLVATGTAMVGSAIGPSLGNGLIGVSQTRLLVPSYAILASLPALACVTHFLLPHDSSRTTPIMSGLHTDRKSSRFLRPLNLLKPSVSGNHSLLLLAISYSIHCFVAGASTVKLQYAAFTYHWDTVETGSYLTILGASRVVCLLLIVPVILYLWKRKVLIINDQGRPGLSDHYCSHGGYGSLADQNCSLVPHHPNPSAVPFHCPSTNTSQSSLTLCPSEGDGEPDGTGWKTWTIHHAPPAISHQSYQTYMDYNMVRLSIGWGLLCCFCLLMSRDVRSFVIPSALEALAGCTGPGIQAVALSLLRTVEGEELGRAEDLISCFSLIRIVMYELLGPLVFGTVYVQSTARFHGSGKSFMGLIAGLELANLVLLNYVNI